MWKGSQTNKEHLVSNFIVALEDGQRGRGGEELNLLISELRKSCLEGKPECIFAQK